MPEAAPYGHPAAAHLMGVVGVADAVLALLD